MNIPITKPYGGKERFCEAAKEVLNSGWLVQGQKAGESRI